MYDYYNQQIYQNTNEIIEQTEDINSNLETLNNNITSLNVTLLAILGVCSIALLRAICKKLLGRN